MRRARISIVLISAAVLIAGLLIGWRLGAVHKELSDAYGMAWLMDEVWSEKSGSKKHDLRIDLIYGGSISQIRTLRSTLSGRIVEPFILKGSSLQAEHARFIHGLHIETKDEQAGPHPEEAKSEQVTGADR